MLGIGLGLLESSSSLIAIVDHVLLSASHMILFGTGCGTVKQPSSVKPAFPKTNKRQAIEWRQSSYQEFTEGTDILHCILSLLCRWRCRCCILILYSDWGMSLARLGVIRS